MKEYISFIKYGLVYREIIKTFISRDIFTVKSSNFGVK
jgi:hypothetical protein